MLRMYLCMSRFVRGCVAKTQKKTARCCVLFNKARKDHALARQYRSVLRTSTRVTGKTGNPTSAISQTHEHMVTKIGMTSGIHTPVQNVKIPLRFEHATHLLRRSTLGDRAFPAAAARAWNSLPCHMSGTCLPCSPSAGNSRLYCLGCRTLSIDSF